MHRLRRSSNDFSVGTTLQLPCFWPRHLNRLPASPIAPMMQPFWRRDWSREGKFFFALLVLHLIPIWVFDYIPTQDGPAHLYNSRIVGEWYWSDFAVFREYLELNDRFDPTWFGHLLLASFMKVFSPAISEKLFLSIYVIALPVAIRSALGVVSERSRFLSILGFPFIYNSVFHWGFHSFAISMAVFFFFIGYWIRHAPALDLRRGLVLMLLSVLLYFTHVVTMAMAYVAAALIAGVWWSGSMIDLWRRGGLAWRSTVQLTWRLLALPGFSLVPAFGLFGLFMSDRTRTVLPGHPLDYRLRDLLNLGELYAFQRTELVFSTALAVVFWLLSASFAIDTWRRRRFQAQHSLLVVALVFTLIYLVVPEPVVAGKTSSLGGGFMTERLNLFPFFALLLWLGSWEYTTVRIRAIQITGTAVALGFLGLHFQQYRSINEQVDEYRSAFELVPPGATVLPLAAAYGGLGENGAGLTDKVDPFRHASNRIGAERPVVVLLNYEAELDYFPVRFAAGRIPSAHIGAIEDAPPEVHLKRYAEETDGRIDYVMLWLGRKRNVESPVLRDLYRQLDLEYTSIFVSKNELAELYVRVGANHEPAAVR